MLEIVINLSLIFIAAISIGALGAYFSEKAGIANIAVDGVMIVGALAFSIVHSKMPSDASVVAMVISILIAGVAGILVGMLFSLLTVTMKSDHIIAGTAVNLLTPALAMAVMGMLYNSSYIAFNYTPIFFVEDINIIAIGFTIALLLLVVTSLIKIRKQKFEIVNFIKDSKFRIKNIATVVVFVATTITWIMSSKLAVTLKGYELLQVVVAIVILLAGMFLINKTKIGLRIKASGEYPQALAAAGVSVYKTRYIALGIFGFLAGVAGALIMPLLGSFSGHVNGYGFIAVAVLVVSSWKIKKLLIAAPVIGVLIAIGNSGELIPVINMIPREYIRMIPFIVPIVVLIFASKNSKAPKAVGQIYDKSKR